MTETIANIIKANGSEWGVSEWHGNDGRARLYVTRYGDRVGYVEILADASVNIQLAKPRYTAGLRDAIAAAVAR